MRKIVIDKHHKIKDVPLISGAGGGGGGSPPPPPVIAPNSLYSTDILRVLIALGEGPIYRVAPNGGTDIELSDSRIDDLLRSDGKANSDKFYYSYTTGTLFQEPLPIFGEYVSVPQSFAAPVTLKKGNADVPESKVELQETSSSDIDELNFNFVIPALATSNAESGDVNPATVTVRISLFPKTGEPVAYYNKDFSITAKTDVPVKQSFKVAVRSAFAADIDTSEGVRFTVTKISNDPVDSYLKDTIQLIGWDEITYERLAYPRTALLGVAIKATAEHQGSIPRITTLIKGLIVKVPSNYSQPTIRIDFPGRLAESYTQVDWREVEGPYAGSADTIEAVYDPTLVGGDSVTKLLGNLSSTNVLAESFSGDSGSGATFFVSKQPGSDPIITWEGFRPKLNFRFVGISGLIIYNYVTTAVLRHKTGWSVDVPEGSDLFPAPGYSAFYVAGSNPNKSSIYFNRGLQWGGELSSGAPIATSQFNLGLSDWAIRAKLGWPKIANSNDEWTVFSFTENNEYNGLVLSFRFSSSSASEGKFRLYHITGAGTDDQTILYEQETTTFNLSGAGWKDFHFYVTNGTPTLVFDETTFTFPTLTSTPVTDTDSFHYMGGTSSTISSALNSYLGRSITFRSSFAWIGVQEWEVYRFSNDTGSYSSGEGNVLKLSLASGTKYRDIVLDDNTIDLQDEQTTGFGYSVDQTFKITKNSFILSKSVISVSEDAVDGSAIIEIDSIVPPYDDGVEVSISGTNFIDTGESNYFLSFEKSVLGTSYYKVHTTSSSATGANNALKSYSSLSGSFEEGTISNELSSISYVPFKITDITFKDENNLSLSPFVRGYTLQGDSLTVIKDEYPQIYKGTWDGTFVYSWTQNPVWILYDLFTNTSYGLGIPENNIDKFNFYKVAQYCDACDPVSGRFVGVDALADGSFRYKPRNYLSDDTNTQIGLPKDTLVRERRFICDITISDRKQALDTINNIAAAIRAIPVYSGGKIVLAIDMPTEYPSMVFNESNISKGSFNISGTSEAEILTGVEASYIDFTNHFKREVVRLDTNEQRIGRRLVEVDNILTIDLHGVTRRSQALRTAQYYLAASKYQRRKISFETGTEAIYLSPGDVISVSSTTSGVAYGYGGKISSNSALGEFSNTSIYLEHFTTPAISSSVFLGNTYPIALRVIKNSSDRIDTYILSNTDFSLSSSDNTEGTDTIRVSAVSQYNPSTKLSFPINSFLANNVPSVGDIWSLGEIENPLNFYSSKAGKLFKVIDLNRDGEDQIRINALEYIPEVYEDSDSFIEHEPTAYLDIPSGFEAPPVPDFTFTSESIVRPDGSIQYNGVVNFSPDADRYYTKFEPIFEIQKPASYVLEATQPISSYTDPDTEETISGVNYLEAKISSGTIEQEVVTISGKNGYRSPIGSIPLLCTNYYSDGLGTLTMTLEGLSLCTDSNFTLLGADTEFIGDPHVLEINNQLYPNGLKGLDYIQIPLAETAQDSGKKDFVGFVSRFRNSSREIISYDLTSNTIQIDNTLGNNTNIENLLPSAPFYVNISQILDKNLYSDRSFYIEGSRFTYKTSGTLNGITAINLPYSTRDSSFVRLYVDGILKSRNQYSWTDYNTYSQIVYSAASSDQNYLVEIDVYNVPAIEVGDTVKTPIFSNNFIVTNTSYETTSDRYNADLTNSFIYKIQLDKTPTHNLTGYNVTNITPDLEGFYITTLPTGNVVLDMGGSSYSLANNKIYALDNAVNWEPFMLDSENKVKDIPLGTTKIRAANKNSFGRTSPYVTKSVTIDQLPIQRVQNIQLKESLYREQTGGVSTRVTIEFDHIEDQQVTDYEISYKIDRVDDQLGKDVSGITAFNTIKISTTNAIEEGKVRYTINQVDRGNQTTSNFITVKIVPLNRNIRGYPTVVSQEIFGKTVPPQNIFNFTGGQQTDQITLFWSYPRVGDQLADLDLKEVVIKRIQGAVQEVNIEQFVAAQDLVTVSAGTARKSIPIDTYGTFTYIARTRDTSDILSDGIASTIITTSKPQRTTTIRAYNEDEPSTAFSDLPVNTNSGESAYPSTNTLYNGLVYSDSLAADNANASSSGFSAGTTANDLLATASATYITPIRDVGTRVVGQVFFETEGTNSFNYGYNDTKTVEFQSTSETNSNASLLVDSTAFGANGIGTYLGYANAYTTTGRFDSNNQTWMTGPSNGNVWAIWNPGQHVGDVANANSYALISGLVDADTIRLGASFYANGDPTGSTSFANISTAVGSSYQLVNLTQYSDIGLLTYAGDATAVTTETFIRTSSANDVYYANGNVNISAFDSYTVNDGFIRYEAGSRPFRYFQLKHIINNRNPEAYDYTLDTLRYTVDKEQTVSTFTSLYDSSPTTIDISNLNYLTRPVIGYAVLNQIDAESNPAIAVTTAASNQSISFKLFASNGTGAYNANSTANVMVTIIGV